MRSARAITIALILVWVSGCAQLRRPDPKLCGLAGLLAGGYTGAAYARSLDSGSDWDSATVGGLAAGVALAAASYYVCRKLAEED